MPGPGDRALLEQQVSIPKSPEMNKQQSFGSLMDTSGISKLIKNQGEDTKLDDSFIDQINKL